MSDAQINIPAVMSEQARSLKAALPTDLDFCLIAYSIAAPDHPLMVSNARPSILAAVLKRTIADIEAGKEMKAEREAEAEADPSKRENTQDVLAIGWGHYSDLFLPPMAPVVQRVEMKKAFMAGCSYLFETLNELHNAEPHVALEIVGNIQDELAAFAAAQAEARKHR